MAEKDSAKDRAASSGDKPQPVHQPFQDAHEIYVKALDEAWTKAQRQCQNDQLEFQQRMMKLSRATTPDEFNAAQEGVQQMMAAPTVDPSLSKSLAEAYAAYKNAIKTALSSTNISDLDPASLAAIGQSFSMIAQFAQQSSMLAPPGKTS